MRCARVAGNRLRSARAILSFEGRIVMYVGDRCSIVTFAASRDIDGIRVMAVAPLPITTTFLPVWSRSSGHFWGCTTVPAKSSMPGNSGV